MRLKRGVDVGGVEPELARSIARACHDRWSHIERIAHDVHLSPGDLAPLLAGLLEAGFLESRPAARGSAVEWNTTLAGGSLTMASFLKPISRVKAETILAAVLDRAAGYNDDDAKPYVITEITVFGSYLRSDAAELGDLDLAVTYTPRQPDSADSAALLQFAHASGRRFDTFVAELFWAREDLLRTLRARSGYLNIHTEDVTRFTDQTKVVYRHDAAPTCG